MDTFAKLIIMSAIIFDFDGTIADSFDLVLDLFYEMTKHPRFTPERVAEFRRMASLRKVAKAVGLNTRQGAQMFIKGRALMGRRLSEVPPCKGIEPVLASLHKQGHQLFVMSSNSQRNVEAFLRNNELRGHFNVIYGGVGLLSKAGALNKVIRQNRLDPVQCYYVGDEVRDILAARRARIRSIAVSWGYNDASVLAEAKPFALAKTPKDLVNIVADKGRTSRVLSKARIFSFHRRRGPN